MRLNKKEAEKRLRKAESAFLRQISELVILGYLSRHEKGSYAYELRNEVEKLIFSKNNDAIEQFSQIKEALELIVDKITCSHGKIDKNEIQNIVDKIAFLKFNSAIQTLMKNSNDIDISESLNTLRKLISDADAIISHLEQQRSSIWKSSSGIYATLDRLEKYNLIAFDREEKSDEKDRLLKKMYIITTEGKIYLQKAMQYFYDLSQSIFPRNSQSEILNISKIFENQQMSLILDFILTLTDTSDFSNADELAENLKNADFTFHKFGIFLGWYLTRILMHEPESISTILDKTDSLEEKMVLITALKYILKNTQDSINSISTIVDGYIRETMKNHQKSDLA